MIAAGAVLAGIGSYIIHRTIRSRKANTHRHETHRNGRHLVNAFAKAKTIAHEQDANCS